MILIGAVSAVLAACATPGKSPPPLALKAPENLQATQVLAQAPTADAPDAEWWKAYGDEQLNHLIEHGLETSPTTDIFLARARQAEASVAAARARTLPSVNANISVPYERQSENGLIPPPYAGAWEWQPDARITASYLLDFWGRNRASLAASLSGLRAAHLETEAVRQQLIGQIVAAYIDFAGAHGQKALAQQLVDARQKQLDLTQERVNAGVDTVAELRQAEAALAQSRADFIVRDEDVMGTALKVVALTGDGPDAALSLHAPDIKSPHFGLPTQLPADLLGHRPDVAALREQIEASNQQVNVARAEFYPNINLSAFVGLSSYGIADWLKAGSGIAGVAPAISLPIFDAGARRANLRGREAQRDSAIASYNGILEQALYEVASTLSRMKSVDLQRPELDKAESSAADAWRIARLRYEHGLGNYLNVVIAEAQWIAAARARVDLDAKARNAAATLARAVGGGWTPS